MATHGNAALFQNCNCSVSQFAQHMHVTDGMRMCMLMNAADGNDLQIYS